MGTPLLLFKHEGCEVATTSWTASYHKGTLTIAYLWGADGYAWLDCATSVRRVEFNYTMPEFLAKRNSNNEIDLRWV